MSDILSLLLNHTSSHEVTLFNELFDTSTTHNTFEFRHRLTVLDQLIRPPSFSFVDPPLGISKPHLDCLLKWTLQVACELDRIQASNESKLFHDHFIKQYRSVINLMTCFLTKNWILWSDFNVLLQRNFSIYTPFGGIVLRWINSYEIMKLCARTYTGNSNKASKKQDDDEAKSSNFDATFIAKLEQIAKEMLLNDTSPFWTSISSENCMNGSGNSNNGLFSFGGLRNGSENGNKSAESWEI
ncbi:MAG: hypothetical protein Sylvanvirus40_1 [Sylvanvirus sp.]|uniref:Uncharacterized protein n=1 Tax=Sylvanvirus sp. TaxID=2487774 RepID=A0A3G5AJ37_9VIRU|nr:MAG: hypothetical protein Sylvanvirus40_1 [Sylvanvirus sp.]